MMNFLHTQSTSTKGRWAQQRVLCSFIIFSSLLFTVFIPSTSSSQVRNCADASRTASVAVKAKP